MIVGEFEQQPNERLDYDIDFSEWMTLGDNLNTVEIDVDPVGLTVDPPVINDPVAKLWISGGTNGVRYKVEAKATTEDGRIKEVEILIKVKEV